MAFKKNLILFLLLLVNSCSYFGEKSRGALVWTGILKSPDNQNVQTILKEGRKVIFGQVHIYRDGKNITKYCSLGFNDLHGRRGGVLYGKHLGDAIIDIKDEENYLSMIICVKSSETNNFNYYLKPLKFKVRSDISYWGVLKVFFTSHEKQDVYRDDTDQNYNSPWIERVEYTHPEEAKQFMEKRYKMVSQDQINIFKTDKAKKI